MSAPTFLDLLKWHGGCCAFCGKHVDELVIDHDHETGLVRGLLCGGCNSREAWLVHATDVSWVRYRQCPPAQLVGLSLRYRGGMGNYEGIAIRPWPHTPSLADSPTVMRGHHRAPTPFGMVEVDHPSPWPDRDAPIQLLAPDEVPREALGGHSPAWLVRAAATMVLEGASLRSVASDWNTAGYPSPRGNSWTGQGLSGVLENPQLAGYATHRGKIVVDAQGQNFAPHDPVLERATYERLATERSTRRTGAHRASSDSELRGLLRCGRCGATMAAGGNGAKASYQCGLRRRGGSGACQGVVVSRTRAEAAVWAAVLEVLADPAQLGQTLANTEDGVAAHLAHLADLDGRATLLQAQLERLEEMELAGVFTDRNGPGRQKRHHARLTEGLDQVLDEQQQLLARPALATGWLDPRLPVEVAVAALPEAKRRQLLRELLSHIVVIPARAQGVRFTPDRLTFVWQPTIIAPP